MRYRSVILLMGCFISLLNPLTSTAQADLLYGTWKQVIPADKSHAELTLELQIGKPEKNLLYPALLIWKMDKLSGSYRLLLTRKNIRQLAISKHKILQEETGIQISNWFEYLNGLLTLSRDNKGNLFFELERIAYPKTPIFNPSIQSLSNAIKPNAEFLLTHLKTGQIKFQKAAEKAMSDSISEKILYPESQELYYGIADSATTKTLDATLVFPGSTKSSNGTITVTVNGKTIVDMNNLGYNRPREEIRLDTGLNIISLFVEQFGKTVESTGKLQIVLGQQNLLLDFSRKQDINATCLTARIYCEKSISDSFSIFDAYFNNRIVSGKIEQTPIDSTLWVKPQIGIDATLSFEQKEKFKNSLQRDAIKLGNVSVQARKLILAFWDDAIEDGDTISLSLNGQWIARGLAVKKQPQFMAIYVEPGPNKITFIADNLGAIIPNTAILEISDGRIRKSFMIDTNLKQNNLIDIFYDSGPH